MWINYFDGIVYFIKIGYLKEFFMESYKVVCGGCDLIFYSNWMKIYYYVV